MKIEALSGIFAMISDGWANFKTPESPQIIGIWDRALSPHSEKSVLKAIETLYHRERFFSFSDLVEILGDMTKPQLMPKADAIATIKKMATNSRQDISDRPEIIQQTIRHAGGLLKLGQRDWDQWTEKEVAAAYDEAARVIERDELLKLGESEVRMLNE